MKTKLFMILGINFFICLSVFSLNQVKIVRDKYWVPHIIGASSYECGYGLAQCMAEDHPLDLVNNVLTIRGEMANYYGVDYFVSDYLHKGLGVVEKCENNYQNLTNNYRQYLEGFALGINDYFNQNPSKLPVVSSIANFLPVTGVDLYALNYIKIISQQLRDLNKEISDSLGYISGKKQAEDMSNQWAIQPKLTQDNATYLLVDPHMPFDGLSSSYEAHLISEDGELNFEGWFATGQTAAYMGHNKTFAWSFTANTPDNQDGYIVELNPSNPNQYFLDGTYKNIDTSTIHIEVLGIDSSIIVFSSMDHGIKLRDLGSGKILMGKFVLAGSTPLGEQTYSIMKSNNVNDFKAAMQMHQLDRWNAMAADEDGNIYYVFNGLVYERNNAEAARNGPLDGSNSYYLWQDLIPYSELPAIENPLSGFVQNCNNAPWYVTDNVLYFQGITPVELYNEDFFGVRGRRVTELIKLNEGNINMEICKNIALDKKMVGWDSIKPVLQLALIETAASGYSNQLKAEKIADSLFAWDGFAEKNSTAMTIFNEWALLLKDTIDFLAPSEINSIERAFLIKSLVQVEDILINYFDSSNVAWGKIHGFERNGKWVEVSGGHNSSEALASARLGSWGERDQHHRFDVFAGNNFLMVIRLKKGEKSEAWTMKPYGQSKENLLSEHYMDLTNLYSADSLRKTWYEEDEFLANAEATINLSFFGLSIEESKNVGKVFSNPIKIITNPDGFNIKISMDEDLTPEKFVIYQLSGQKVIEHNYDENNNQNSWYFMTTKKLKRDQLYILSIKTDNKKIISSRFYY